MFMHEIHAVSQGGTPPITPYPRPRSVSMTFRHSLLLLLALALVSCSRTVEQDLLTKAQHALDQKKPADALVIYRQFLADYPESKSVPEVLFRIGSLELSEEKKPEAAIATFSRVVEKNPSSPYAHKCLFMAAFIYSNQLNDTAKAKEGYERYLRMYPDSAMAETARFELANLGKSAEEILRQMQDSSARKATPVATK